VLECECTEYSHADIEPSACREGGQVYLFVSVRGLFPEQAGFVYELNLKWSRESDKLTHAWTSLLTTQTLTRSDTASYTLREPLVQLGVMVLDTYNNNRFFVDVTVRDMHPALTTEEALIGARHIDSSVNTVRLKCVENSSSLLASTASREREGSKTIFLATRAELDSDESLDEVRGVGHPAVFIDKYTTLECECDDTRSLPCRGGGACYSQGVCRDGLRMQLIVSISGLLPSFCRDANHFQLNYKLVSKTSYLNEEEEFISEVKFSTGMSHDQITIPLVRSNKKGASLSRVLVTLINLYPGLTSEEAFLGGREFDLSDAAIVSVECVKHQHQPSASLGMRIEDGVLGVIHVGAHLGQEAPGYFLRVGDKVIHIECNAQLVPRLRENVGCFGHQVVQACVWSRDEERMFHVASNDAESSSLVDFFSQETLSGATVSINNSWAVKTESWPAIIARQPEIAKSVYNMLVLDTQGAEYDILLGIVETLGLGQFFKIQVECSNKEFHRGQKLQPDIEALLQSHGFVNVRNHYPVHGDVVFINPSYRPPIDSLPVSLETQPP
jgi:FkbM family methyltransferase